MCRRLAQRNALNATSVIIIIIIIVLIIAILVRLTWSFRLHRLGIMMARESETHSHHPSILCMQISELSAPAPSLLATTDHGRSAITTSHSQNSCTKPFLGVRSPFDRDRRFGAFLSLSDCPMELHLDIADGNTQSSCDHNDRQRKTPKHQVLFFL